MARRKPARAKPARRAAARSKAKAPTAKRPKAKRPPEELFAALGRAHQEPANEKIRGLLHELQVHGEEITAQNDQLKRTQGELEVARDRYADLYDFAPIGYLTISHDNTIADTNLAAAALLGHKRAFLEHLPLSAVVHAEDRLRLRRFLSGCRGAEGPAQTIEIKTKDARTLRFTCRSQGAGRDARLFTAVVDVTDERRLAAENTLALDRVKALIERLVSVQEDERRRIARNLHDHLGQQLTALRLNIGSLKETAEGPEEVRQRLEAIDRIAAGIDRDLDFLAWELRPVALDDVGLNAALGGFITEWSSTQKVPAEFHDSTSGLRRLLPQVESQLYRIVQEALNNIAKHARAKRVSVLLERRGEDAILIVEDDGQGFDVDGQSRRLLKNQGLGLVSMQERAALVGGTVQFESSPGKGATVVVRIPVRQAGETFP
jgi:PAS domain S-box-containing protein